MEETAEEGGGVTDFLIAVGCGMCLITGLYKQIGFDSALSIGAAYFCLYVLIARK